MHHTQSSLRSLPSRYRATFINSLAGAKQAFLVGTIGADGTYNLAIFNSLIHFGADPALWGMICRPDTVQRDTLRNITETGCFTFNFVSAHDFEKAHQTSAKYPSGVSEFDAVGFVPETIPNFQAPFVKDAIVKVGLKLEQRIDIVLNGTILLIGSLQFVTVDDLWVSADGFVALDKAQSLVCTGLDAYFTLQRLGRLTYAKADEMPRRLADERDIYK